MMKKNNRSPARLKTRERKKPGTTGEGDYYHIELQGKRGFVSFRTQDVGKRGHLQRVAGKRADGSWETVKWLIGKEDAHIQRNHLVADSKAAQKLLDELGQKPVHLRGDRFKAKPQAKKGTS